MPTRELKRIGANYIASDVQCGACKGCSAEPSAIVMPFELPAGFDTADSLRISMSLNNQLMTLFYSWILPLLGCVAASFVCSLAGLSDVVSTSIVCLAFVAGLLLCRTQGAESVSFSIVEKETTN